MTWLGGLFRRLRAVVRRVGYQRGAESDVPADQKVARSREHGGPDTASRDLAPGHTVPGDAASTTGTGRNEPFVGRVSGADVGYVGETGAEARREAGESSRRRADERP